jgi:hypothetical protein
VTAPRHASQRPSVPDLRRFARLIGISDETLRHWETGRRRLQVSGLAAGWSVAQVHMSHWPTVRPDLMGQRLRST